TVGPWPVVFPGGERVRLLDTDSYYHLRHARHALHDYPSLARVDTAWDYPWPLRSDGAGLFDLAVATAALPAGEAGLPRVAAFAPVALLALTVLALVALARRWLSPALALWVAGAFLVYPGLSLAVTTLGFLD